MRTAWVSAALLAAAPGCFEHEDDGARDAVEVVADTRDPQCPAGQPPDGSQCTVEDQDCTWGPEACQCGNCHPAFGCSCRDGTWRCWHTDPIPEAWCPEDVPDVPDPSPDVAGEIPSSCPAEPPIGVSGSCAGGQVCNYGQECCCGQCHPSLVCECGGQGWGCYATDACMIPGCPDVP